MSYNLPDDDDDKEQGYLERIGKSVVKSTVDTTIGVASTPLAIVVEPVKTVVRIAQAILGQKNDTDDD